MHKSGFSNAFFPRTHAFSSLFDWGSGKYWNGKFLFLDFQINAGMDKVTGFLFIIVGWCLSHSWMTNAFEQ